MDFTKFNSAKAISEAFKEKEAKERLIAEAKRAERSYREKELELSHKGNVQAEQANKIAIESNKIAQESNQISRRSNTLAWVAIAISILSPIVTYFIK